MKNKQMLKLLLQGVMVLGVLSACHLKPVEDQATSTSAIAEIHTTATPTEEIQAEETTKPKEPPMIVDEQVPQDAVDLILRHFKAIEEGDKATIISTLGGDEGGDLPRVNIVTKGYFQWLANQLVDLYADTGIRVKEIKGSDGEIFFVTVDTINNKNADTDTFTFAMNSGYSTPWNIGFYTDVLDEQVYQEETLRFVDYEDILVDSRITVTEAELLNTIKKLIETVESGDEAALLKQMGEGNASTAQQWIEAFTQSKMQIKKIELFNEGPNPWDTVKVTAHLNAYDLDTALYIPYQPYQRLEGETVWRINDDGYLYEEVCIGGQWQSMPWETHDIYDWMALNFIVEQYPAFFLDHSIDRWVSDAYHDGIDIPIPKGMTLFADANEIGEPDYFALYRLSDGTEQRDVYILLVDFSSFWYGGQQVYGFVDGHFQHIDQYARGYLDFWKSQNYGTFLSIRNNDYYNFSTLNFPRLRSENQFWGYTIREEVSYDIVWDKESDWHRLSNHVGFQYLEKLEPLVSGWQGEPEGLWDNYIANYASEKAIEHITNPADRLVLALKGTLLSYPEASYIAVVVPKESGSEWHIAVDEKEYRVAPQKPQLLQEVEPGSTEGERFVMNLEGKDQVLLQDMIDFIRQI